jgi:xanthine dehydrogenase accessory factor
MNRRLTLEALRLLERHEPFVRATVVQSSGSVPGKVGASMIVRYDGSTLGTVGGAALEEQVKAASARAHQEHRGELLHFELAAWRPEGLPSLCGGAVDVAIEFVPAQPCLLLWGGGHVAAAIARLLPGLEFDYAVADDRAEWVTEERFPEAIRREVVAPERLWEVFEPTSFTHVYLLGYDATKDGEVLFRSLDVFPQTIGLIASASKRAHLFHALRGRGASEAALARVQSPIGLPIGAETPAEIAVSVVAEIVRSQHPPAPAPSRRGAKGVLRASQPR